MFLSKLFLPILKNLPSDAKIKSHQLMLRAGMIKQSSAGIYSWLPLGLKVMKKIEQVVREEQNKIGAQELLMPTIQSAEIWKESGRYNDYGDEMLRIKDRQGREMLYGPTNEELITDIFRSSIKSYKSLPQMLYHIQWKFRDEIRPRFGVMRCREFFMKDAYSFDLDDASAKISYNKMFFSYLKTFKRLGLEAIPMSADTGPIGGDLSHEFIILADTGESKIYTDKSIFEIDLNNYSFDNLSLEKMLKDYSSVYAVTAEKYKKEIENIYQNVFVSTWSDTNKSFFNALKIERNVMFIILTLIIIVAAFNIISGLTILIKNKTKEIAIIKTLGLSENSIIKSFFLTGFTIGFLATISGVFFGIIFSIYIDEIRNFLAMAFGLNIFPSDVYYLDEMPSQINPFSVSIIFTLSLLITSLASYFPAKTISKMKTTDALKYE